MPVIRKQRGMLLCRKSTYVVYIVYLEAILYRSRVGIQRYIYCAIFYLIVCNLAVHICLLYNDVIYYSNCMIRLHNALVADSSIHTANRYVSYLHPTEYLAYSESS